MAGTSVNDVSFPPAAVIAEATRVLLIEDSASYAGYLQALFYMSEELEGEVVVASTLAAGVAELRAHGDFAAVLLDLNLPDSRGLGTLSSLLTQVPNANVIVLTGMDDRSLGVQAVGVGAQDYLVKNNELETQLPRAIRFSIQRKHFLQRLEEAQQLARIGNWEMRPVSNYFYASPMIYHFFQVDRKRMSCDHYNELVQREDCPLRYLLLHLKRAPAEEFFTEIVEWKLPDSQLVYAQLNSRRSEMPDGSAVYAGTLQDVTLQRRAEELQRARDLAEETARVREQVLANVSHELRTPMNAILGMSNILAVTELNEEQQECNDYIQEASQVLLGIINDILLTSSLQEDVIETTADAFDLLLTVRRIVEVIKPKAVAKNIELTHYLPENWPGRVIGDKQRLSQVLFNILGNAVKFTVAGRVELRVSLSKHRAEAVEVSIEVKDTGPGIPADMQAQIFQPFVRVKQANRSVEGTGLGLNIAQQLVARMGGRITLESQEGVGSTFTIYLPMPLAKAEESTVKGLARNASPLQLTRLLVVEDHPMNQLVIRRTLERELPDLELHIAESGEKAIELVSQHTFELILMDLQLPGMDGYETTSAIRKLKNGAYRHIPILAMTAQAQVAKDERYLEVGMLDYVLKPFDPKDLFNKLAQYTQINA